MNTMITAVSVGRMLRMTLHRMFKTVNFFENRLVVEDHYDCHDIRRIIDSFERQGFITKVKSHDKAKLNIPIGTYVKPNDNYDEDSFPGTVVLMPCMGLVSEEHLLNIKKVWESFLWQITGEFFLVAVCFDGDSYNQMMSMINIKERSNCYIRRIQGLEKWSRAKAFNLAVMNIYGDRYVFHDRDLVVPSNFIESVNNCNKRYFINYTDVKYGKKNIVAQGGSNTIDWDFFYMSGGMCSDMDGWGCEDKEFDNRMSKLFFGEMKSHRLPLSLTHMDHECVRKANDINYEIRDKHETLSAAELQIKCNYLYGMYKKMWGVI